MGSCFYILELLKSKRLVLTMISFLVGDTPSRSTIYGTISGVISKILVYPLDTGKKLLQVYRLSPEKQTVAEFISHQYRATGIRGLYAGVVAATLKSGLSSGLIFGFYAFAKKYLWESNSSVCK